ncbi:glutamine synthetase family protein [Conexibacter arvalis]|uniref:Glutamine synthetase n=1 Tax=Conexibacter arvalis TaxID=912552 RepID=A0A840I9E2_9ACTN|nr:glutamine synthetase family protein [Conexibacter arvalis]MBB4660550.1 glutamine synthetase [Conexibacter arvalis]
MGDASEWVVLSTPDLNGVLRGKALSARQFADAVHRDAVGITDLILATDALDTPIATSTCVGPGRGAGDLLLRPDLSTLTPLPWRPSWAWCLADVRWQDGSPCDIAPRVVCDTVLTALEATHGLRVCAAFEFEFRLHDVENGAPVTGGRSYSAGELGALAPFLDALRTATSACGLDLSALHTEAGPGLVEVNLAPAIGTAAADHAALLRACVEEVASQQGMRASFLAKPAVGEEGSGGHLHLSLLDRGDANVFAGDLRAGEPPAPPLRHAVAGLVETLAPLSAIYNPAINSYKRLVPGWFAPVTASWALDDRAVAVRLVAGADPRATHVELRRAGADANPHLVLAAAVAAIHGGLDAGREPPPAATPEAPGAELPRDLATALGAFRAADELHARLGRRFCAHFAATREWELRAWQEVVTEWERTRVEGRASGLFRSGRS